MSLNDMGLSVKQGVEVNIKYTVATAQIERNGTTAATRAMANQPRTGGRNAHITTLHQSKTHFCTDLLFVLAKHKECALHPSSRVSVIPLDEKDAAEAIAGPSNSPQTFI